MAFSRVSIAGVLFALLAMDAAQAGPAEDGHAAFQKGDFATAIKLLSPLARQGDLTAEFDIGLMYFSGHGLPQDYHEAAAWFLLAAQTGNGGAQVDIGILYATGNGVPQNDLQAYMWFSLSAAKIADTAPGSPAGYRDHVGERMLPDQVRRATELAKQCEASNYVVCGAPEEILRQCTDGHPNIMVSGCTAVIQSAQKMDPPGFAFHNRAEAYVGKQDYNHAIDDYTKAIQLDPNDANSLKGRGFAYAAIRDYPHGIQDLDMVLERDPNDKTALTNRGVAHLHMRDYDLAMADLNRCIQLDPDNIDALRNRGVVHFAKLDLDAAIRDFDHVIMLQPNNASVFFERGQAKRAKGDTSGGETDIARAKQINPNVGQ